MLKFRNMNEQSLKKKVQIIVMAEDEVLLFEFNDKIPGNYKGFQNITGAVEDEESFYEAAKRELIEEAGINSDVIELDLKFEFFDRWKRNCLEKIFLCHLYRKPEIVLNEEHEHFKWMPVKSVIDTDYTFFTNFQAFSAALAYLDKR